MSVIVAEECDPDGRWPLENTHEGPTQFTMEAPADGFPSRRAVEVIQAFSIDFVLYPEGRRFDRDDELVKAHPEYFGTPRRPLV